jgi:hypothetical protein
MSNYDHLAVSVDMWAPGVEYLRAFAPERPSGPAPFT